jgi:Ser/Thr protein kinase RdoA (MazF antagonist)
VKVLPARPHLDHLRRQARDHLRALRRLRPDATLSDARAELADQHGFPSWAELRAEVERRCEADAEVLDPATAAAVADRFGLGEPAGEVPLVERSAAGPAFRLTAADGRRLVQEVPPGSDLMPEVRLTAAARDAGVVTPRPVPAVDGRFLAEVDGRSWRCWEWLDTGPAVTRPVDPDTAAAMGTLLAGLHGLAVPAPGEVLPWLARRPAPSAWARLAPDPGRVGWGPLFTAVRPVLEELSVRPEPPAGELVLCHRDLIPANVHHYGRDGLAVVGWERTGPLPARWELGYVLLQWTTGRDERADAATATTLLAAYRAAGGAPDPVDRTLFTAAVTASLNWTCSRLAGSIRQPQDARAAAEVEQLLRTPPTPRRLDALLPG